MFTLLGLLAPVAMILPQPADDGARQNSARDAGLTVPEGEVESAKNDDWLKWLGLDHPAGQSSAKQVRIEGRVVIRVSPRSRRARQNGGVNFLQATENTRIEERKIGKCIPMRGIAGVQAREGKNLLFFMRDQRIVSARLAKACRSEAFYSGFYVQPSKDGQLCVDRDLLKSRSGVSCEVDRLRQLVRVRS